MKRPSKRPAFARSVLARWMVSAGLACMLSGLVIGILIEQWAEDLIFTQTAGLARSHVPSFGSWSQVRASSPDQDLFVFHQPPERDSADLPDPFVAYKVWDSDGRVVRAYDTELPGRQYPDNPRVQAALLGQTVTRFSPLRDSENVLERVRSEELFEVYLPLWDPVAGQVIGVAEFYMDPSGIRESLASVRLRAWTFTAGFAVGVFGVLAGLGTLLLRRETWGRGSKVSTLPIWPPRPVGRAPLSDRWLRGLTAREEEVLALIAQGFTNREVAQRLYLGEDTVKHYVSRLLAKLDVRNRVEAALLYETRRESTPVEKKRA